MANNKEMVFGATQEITTASADDLGAKLSGPAAQMSETMEEEAHAWLENYVDQLAEQTKNSMRQYAMQKAGAVPESGLVVADIEMWDVAAIQPIQVINPPWGAFKPHSIIAGGSLAVLPAILFINPTPLPGGFPTATQYLGGRDFRLRFQLTDLTNVTAGPAWTFTGTFPAIAPVISYFLVPYVPADPGVDPQLMELNVTVDLVDPAQPFAAFATQWVDVDGDPGWPIPQPGGWRFQTPLRFLVYKR